MDRKLEKKIFTPKRIAWTTLSTAFFVLVFYTLLFGDRSSKLNVDTERITVSEVSEGPFLEYIVLPGNVIPITTIYLTAIEGGRVMDKFMEAGRYVEQGEPILQLENTNLMLEIMQREQAFTETENRVRQTTLQVTQNSIQVQQDLIDMDYRLRQNKTNYDRQKKLLEKNATSLQEYENAKYDYEYFIRRKELAIEKNRIDSLYKVQELTQMVSSLSTLRDNLEFVRRKLDNLTVRATVSGNLTALNAELGETKTMGEGIGQIDVLDGFKIQCNPDEHYITRIPPNVALQGSFTLPNSSEVYYCKVSKVFPQVLGGAFRIWLQFEGRKPPGVRNGQTIRVSLELGSPLQALLLSKGGFYSSTGGQWVYVIDSSGDFAIKRRIKIGRMNPQVFEVLEGLEPGERVITSSYDNFGDIDKLILKDNSN